MNGGSSRKASERRTRWTFAEPRWVRDQRTRRRRMTARGRATLLVMATFAAAGLGWLVEPKAPVYAARTPGVGAAEEPALPPVDAKDEGSGGGSDTAPEFILERLPLTRDALDLPVTGEAPDSPPSAAPGRLFERVVGPGGADEGRYTVEYTLDAELTREVFRVLRRARVKLGNVIVMEPASGRVLAYASTDPVHFPPTRSYPAASLVKVITAAAALDRAPETARLPCRFRGSPYRLTASRIDPPRHGRTVSLRRALATSNNQCFAQLAVHAVGAGPLIEAIGRFGWLSAPAPAHAAGRADPGEDRFDVGRLGCGLAGCRITPLHAAQLAASLVHGELVPPRWIERAWDPHGRMLTVPTAASPRQVLEPDLAVELRSMLVDTTRSGTARSAFRTRRGRPLLGDVAVAGKTGSLSGKDPDGRYEWFVGVAPAEAPRIAIATVLVQGDLYWRTSSQVAAEVLHGLFCDEGECAAELAGRFVRVPPAVTALASGREVARQ